MDMDVVSPKIGFNFWIQFAINHFVNQDVWSHPEVLVTGSLNRAVKKERVNVGRGVKE